MDKLITFKNVIKNFGSRKIINGINFTISRGEVVALIGENGSGKSTTIALLLGSLEADSGEIIRWSKNYKEKTGAQLQSTPFFEGFSCAENLEYFSALYGIQMSKEDIYKKLDEWNLGECKDTQAVKLSLGQQKRLAIAVTTLHQPELIVLDEPSAGLDPKVRYDIHKLIKQFSNTNTAIMFSSHDMEEVEKLATRILFIYKGTIIEDGNPNALLEKYGEKNLEKVYLNIMNRDMEGEYV
ncbi:ABC transporter ATP-binding protein [Clostridium perfringens]|nr:ABC transporter ATP-binding protein [Clostridium perfringens]